MTPPRRRRNAAEPGPRPLSASLDDAIAGLSPPRRRQPGGRGAPGEGADGSGASAQPSPSAGTVAAVFTRWEEVVGTSLARHVRPLRVDGSVLVVAVERPPWATQVRALAPGILARVAEMAGEDLMRLEVVVRPATGR